MTFPDEELTRCRQRRIQAWEDLEEYENFKVKREDGLEITNILIERARADIELLDFLIASLEVLAADTPAANERQGA